MTAYCVPAGENTNLVGLYMHEKTGMVLQPGMFTAFAVFNGNDEFIGGVVITNYRGFDCEISCAAETSIAWNDGVCRAVFRYIFWQLGCVRCTSSVRKGNKRARAFLDGLGFTLEGNLRLAYDGTKDALVYGLLASECRYLADPVEPGSELDAEDGEANQNEVPEIEGGSQAVH